MAQITILDVHVRELIVPTFIRKVVIDVKKHFEILQTLDSEKPGLQFFQFLSNFCDDEFFKITFSQNFPYTITRTSH